VVLSADYRVGWGFKDMNGFIYVACHDEFLENSYHGNISCQLRWTPSQFFSSSSYFWSSFGFLFLANAPK